VAALRVHPTGHTPPTAGPGEAHVVPVPVDPPVDGTHELLAVWHVKPGGHAPAI
jgi:hypothetical protein